MCGPEDAQHLERAPGQGHVAVPGSLSAVDMDKHALTVDVGDLEPQAFGKAQAAGIDSGQTDTVLLTRDTVQYATEVSMSTSTLDSVLAQALQMPDNDRARIAEQLISSLDDSVDPDVEALWQQEIQHRLL